MNSLGKYQSHILIVLILIVIAQFFTIMSLRKDVNDTMHFVDSVADKADAARSEVEELKITISNLEERVDQLEDYHNW